MLKLESNLKLNNKGMSLVELIVVMAIMVVLASGSVIGLSLLINSEAKQAAYKFNAELNELKTGTMTRAGEVLYLRYVSDTQVSDTEGADKPGFYAEKAIATIDNKPVVKWDYDDHEYTSIGSGKISITAAFADGSTFEVKGTDALRIEYNRRTGVLEVAQTGTSAALKSADADFSAAGTLKSIQFVGGQHVYEIDFEANGKHTLKKN